MYSGFKNFCILQKCKMPLDRPLPPPAYTQAIKTDEYGCDSLATAFSDAITTNPNMRICKIKSSCDFGSVCGL
jgi:hypothetical protein